MVAAEVERLPEWSSLDRDAQLKLLFTALFHDAGKPATTHVDRRPAGLIHLSTLWSAWKSVGVCFGISAAICVFVKRSGLIRYHGRPPIC